MNTIARWMAGFRSRVITKIRAQLHHWLALDSVDVRGSFQNYGESSGQAVNPNSVLQLSAVWACVRLISETVAALPYNVYKRLPDGSRQVASLHSLQGVLRQPNAHMTPVQFWQAFLASMLLWGNGYAEKIISGGRVVGLELLHPAKVTLWINQSGQVIYRYFAHGKIREIPESKVLHIPALSTDGRVGIAPVRAGVNVFGAAQAADSVSTNFFKNGLHPTVAFKYPQVMDSRQRDEGREAIKMLSGAVNAGEPVILEAGTDLMVIGVPPKDAEVLGSRNFSVEEISRWFGVPPFMIGHSEKSTSWGTGIEQQMIGFITFCLMPWTTRIQQGVNRACIPPAERNTYYTEHVLDGLLRGDSAARQAFYASALQNGWMNRTTVAKLENLPSPPGGDVYTVQSNLIPLDKLGAVEDDSEQVLNALATWLTSRAEKRSKE